MLKDSALEAGLLGTSYNLTQRFVQDHQKLTRLRQLLELPGGLFARTMPELNDIQSVLHELSGDITSESLMHLQRDILPVIRGKAAEHMRDLERSRERDARSGPDSATVHVSNL